MTHGVSTLELLTYLLRNPPQGRAMLALGLRSGTRDRRLAGLVQALGRSDVAQTVVLTAPATADVKAVLGDVGETEGGSHLDLLTGRERGGRAGWFTGSEAENIPLGPVVAAAVVTLAAGGTMWRRWIHTVRSCGMPWPWLAVALVVPIVMHVAQVLVNAGFAAPLPTADQLSTWPEVPVTFVVMLVLVGFGEEAGWTAFATPLLLTRHPFLVVWGLMSAMRIAWHLPLMLSGDLPWVLGILGNAGFQLVLLAVYVLSGFRWGTAAVWHASLNALGGPFLFQMVEGSDRDRLAWIMSVGYAVLAIAFAAVTIRRVGREPRPPAEATPAERVVRNASFSR